MKKNHFTLALALGVLSSFFFAFNFILIRSMNLGGGYYLWTASLRYLFTLPLMALVVTRSGGFSPVFASIRRHPAGWLIFSTIGFGLFYAPLSAASVYGESWFTASIWQFTIVAGVLLTPLFGRRIPVRNLLFSLLIVAGILIMQYSRFRLGVKADWPMLILTKNDYFTLSLYAYNFKSIDQTDFGALFACYILQMLPMLIFYLFAQKHIIGGLTAGSVKG